MQRFLQKFDEQYKGKKYIEIEFASDNPLTKKYIRYNQGGDVCHCIDGNKIGSQKTKNGWQPIDCDIEKCQYRQKNEQGKTACNRIGWLKFFIPSVCQDRIWLMKITGQKSIDRLDAYINLQKSKGNTLNGKYILFLKQEEQTSKFTGKTFNNYILDIVKKEDFIQTNQIPQTQEITKKTNELSTKNAETVNNNVAKQESNVTNIQDVKGVATTQTETDKPKENTPKKTSTPKETTKKETKSKTKKSEDKKQEENPPKENVKEESKAEDDELKNCYALLRTFNETIANKQYLIGEFADMKDKISNIVIRPEDAEELSKCDLGTFVRLDIMEKGGRKFAMKLEFIEKMLKKVAA